VWHDKYFLTHRYNSHRRVNFKSEYLGKFEVIFKNPLECEAMAQEKMLEDKTGRKKISG
jgi:hypothetical protein